MAMGPPIPVTDPGSPSAVTIILPVPTGTQDPSDKATGCTETWKWLLILQQGVEIDNNTSMGCHPGAFAPGIILDGKGPLDHQGSFASGQHPGPQQCHMSPEPQSRAREPPCCWELHLSREPRTKQNPSASKRRDPACPRPLMNPWHFQRETPSSPQSAGPAPATVITLCLRKSPLPVQLGRVRASVCGSASHPRPPWGLVLEKGCVLLQTPPHPWLSSKARMLGGSGIFSPLLNL